MSARLYTTDEIERIVIGACNEMLEQLAVKVETRGEAAKERHTNDVCEGIASWLRSEKKLDG